MVQRIPLVQVMLICSLTILIPSVLVSAQDNCVNHGFYCNEDPSAGQLIPCCDGETCVVSQHSNNCDCSERNAHCGGAGDLACCKGLFCSMAKEACVVPCVGLGANCYDDECCEGLYCEGCTDEGTSERCVSSEKTNGTTGMSNNGTTTGF